MAGLVVFGGTLSAYAACSNPSPLPSGYAAPCPVFSVSPASISQSGTLTLSATPQAGTDYIYTTAYYAKGSTWIPVTLTGNNAAPSYSSGPAQGSLSPSVLSTLPIGTNYVVLWDWLWDATAGCYKGPGLNQCNTGTWRVQLVNLTAGSPTPTPVITPTPTPTPSPANCSSGRCFYIAANGSDSNNGTSKSTPWLHAPGMPNCTATCASTYPTQYAAHAGDRIIFRGGDTWHFGNSAASPYVGGTWNWTWDGTSTNCDTSDNPSAVRTSCIYVGVDQTWYSGASWKRPIMTGDNQISTSPVANCTYGNVGAMNEFLSVNNNAFAWFDNFEFTGMCQQTASAPSNNYLNAWDLYIKEAGAGTVVVQNIYSNLYAHGWTHLGFSCSDTGGEPVGQCFSEGFIGNGGLGSTIGPGNICDGWDSDPTAVGCIMYDPAYLVYDNVFANFAQIVVNRYHVWHDNYWFNYYPTGDGVAHGNSFESNTDAPGGDSNGHNQPNVPFNAFYNNILGHNATGNATNGAVKLWFCPNATAAEYQFNNIVYDQGTGNNWDLAVSSGFYCTTANAGIYLFNNTFEQSSNSGGTTINCPATLTAKGNHIITDQSGGTGFASGSCTIANDVVMTHATAVTQGYMAAGTAQSGNNSGISCANGTTPCAPTAATNSTVGMGANLQSYCTTLLGSSDGDIARAGSACKNGTTDACAYNTSNHTVSCPARTPLARPTSGAWNAGAYEF